MLKTTIPSIKSSKTFYAYDRSVTKSRLCLWFIAAPQALTIFFTDYIASSHRPLVFRQFYTSKVCCNKLHSNLRNWYFSCFRFKVRSEL